MILLVILSLLSFDATAVTLLEEGQQIIQEKSIKPLHNKQLEEAALKGLITSLDPYSYYFNQEEAEDWYKSLESNFFGLGIEMVQAAKGALITDLYEGGPAEKCGIKPGDIIIEVSDQKIAKKSLDLVRNLLLSNKNLPVKIKILRGLEEKDFLVKKEKIIIKPLIKKFDKTLYIRIKSFQKGIKSELEKILKRESFHSIILDLRFNPGGLLDEALALAELFLPKDLLLITLKEKNTTQQFLSKHRDLADGKGLVLLINGFSASAAEIVAIALKDNKRALLVGEKSFGKASVQSTIKMTRGLLKLTTGLYLSPKGHDIDQIGVAPNLSCKNDEDFTPRDLTGPKDLQLARALDLLVVKDFYQDIKDDRPPE
jgi:carboxyl-terminal processing protease